MLVAPRQALMKAQQALSKEGGAAPAPAPAGSGGVGAEGGTTKSKSKPQFSLTFTQHGEEMVDVQLLLRRVCINVVFDAAQDLVQFLSVEPLESSSTDAPLPIEVGVGVGGRAVKNVASSDHHGDAEAVVTKVLFQLEEPQLIMFGKHACLLTIALQDGSRMHAWTSQRMCMTRRLARLW